MSFGGSAGMPRTCLSAGGVIISPAGFANGGMLPNRFPDKGEEPEYFDKEFLRLWFRDNCDPYKDKVLPPAPKELVEELSRRYIRMYEQITGRAFVPGEEPIAARIARNLKPYALSPSR